MEQNYRVRLACPKGDFYQWTVRENLALTLQEVYGHHWDFVCPQHGRQRERPFQAEVKKIVSLSRPAGRASRGGTSP